METRQKKLLGAIAIFHIFNDASVVTLPTIFPLLYTQRFLISRYADIGTLMLVGLASSVLFHFIIGHFARGRHYRRLLILDVLIVGLFLYITPWAKTYGVLMLSYIGLRIGSSVYHPVGASWITNAFPGKILDRALGIQAAFGDLGVLLAFLGTGYLAQHFGWKSPLHFWGILCIAGALIAFLLSKDAMATETLSSDESVSWKETIRDQGRLVPPALLGGIGWGINMAYAPSLLNHRLQAPMSLTGIILGGWIAAGIIASLTYSKVAARIGRYGAIILGCSITSLTTVLIGLSKNILLISILMAIFGWALLLTFPALLALVGSSAKTRNRTAAFSVISNLQIIGNASFVFLCGFMSDAWGIQTPFLLLGALSLAVAFYSASLGKNNSPKTHRQFELDDKPRTSLD